MEYPFSNKEKGKSDLALSRGRMEGIASSSMDTGVWGSNLEDSFSNNAELMNFDVYAGWCNSPSNLSEQMFPYFASSPNFSPFGGLSFMDQYNTGIPMVDGDIVGSSCISGDKMMLNQMDSQLTCPASFAGDGKSSSLLNVEDEVRKSVIPRSLMQSLAEKMLRALYLFKERSGGGILAQMWVPIKEGDQYILSTYEQPYLLDETLSGYRDVSRSFTFATELKPGAFPGLPGRVFTSKVPEWTSNVMYYNKAEYLRINYAAHYEIRGSIALPIFDDDLPDTCCAVLELVTMKEKSNFDSEMENVCSAFQAVKLRSTLPPKLYSQTLSKNQRTALAEITDVLRALCHAHRLPLALTWIPCSYIEGSKDETIRVRSESCNMNLNEKHVLCIEDTACYVHDKEMQGFVHACAEHYLEEGQGIVGKAIQSNHPFFYPDVKEYHISEYPLVHHARKFGLNAAVAIRLRSTCTGDDDYILELFLPVNMKGSTEQQLLLNNLSSIMQRICKSLRTVSDAKLLGTDEELKNTTPVPLTKSSEQSLIHGNLNSADHVTQKSLSESTTGRTEADGLHYQAFVGARKHQEKRKSTAEKQVSLNVLQQYFSGSLKDAAKSIGVCPTTLKRICREYGILRWPSRKINKVNHSLRKIQIVLNSVQGVEGGLKLNSTIGRLVAAGSIISDFENRSSQNTNFGTQSSKSAQPPSSTDIETTAVKTENEYLLNGNGVAGPIALHPDSHKESGSAVLGAGLSCTTSPMVTPSSFLTREEYNRFSSDDGIMKAKVTESHYIAQRSAIDEMDRNLEVDTFMDRDDGVVEHHQLTSSGMTDSSNGSGSGSGSMTNGCSSNSRSFGERPNPKTEASFGDSGSVITIKATYKEDIVRFKFAPSTGWVKLYEEVAKRFQLQTGHFQLKYLDDEEEWVMLASDLDLQECVEVLDFLGTRNVKFLVRDMPISFGSSGGSNGFLGGAS